MNNDMNLYSSERQLMFNRNGTRSNTPFGIPTNRLVGNSNVNT